MTGSFSREAFRVARLIFGSFVYALGVSMTLQANLGYSPWFVFHQGVGLYLGITIGEASILISVVLVAITSLLKERVGIGTISSMVIIGVFVDVITLRGWLPLMQTFIPGVTMMIGGLFVLGVGTVIYMDTAYGSGPRDLIMVVLTKRTGKPVGLCRGCLEAAVLLTGWLMGGYAGIGTVIYAFGIGAAVQIVFSVMRFDVKTIRHESCYETYLRLRNALK